MKILVYIEAQEGHLRRSALELLSYANDLNKGTGGSVTALTGSGTGEETIKCLARYGANKILIADSTGNPATNFSSQAETIRQAAENEDAEIVLFPGSVAGKAIAPMVSAKLKAGMVAGIYALPVSYDPFTINKKVFSGKVIAKVKIRTPRKVLILLPNSFKPRESPVPAVTETFAAKLSVTSPKGISGIRLVDTVKTSNQIKLSEAGVVVSGGRGISRKENWRYVEELAGLLGGATACSRPAWDDGLCPHDGYVGQTGKVISPNVYMALGISGAVQHLAGISSSKLIVAINKDPRAPIFTKADYGIVGDIQEVMPRLIAAIKAFRPASVEGAVSG